MIRPREKVGGEEKETAEDGILDSNRSLRDKRRNE